MSDTTNCPVSPPRRPARRRWRWARRALGALVLVPLGIFAVNYWRALYGDAREKTVAEVWAFANVDSLAASYLVRSDTGPDPVAPVLDTLATQWTTLVNERFPALIVYAQPRPAGDIVIALNPVFYRGVQTPDDLADAATVLGDLWRGVLATAAAPWPTADHGVFEPGVVIVRALDTPAGTRIDVLAESRDGVTRAYLADTRDMAASAMSPPAAAPSTTTLP